MPTAMNSMRSALFRGTYVQETRALQHQLQCEGLFSDYQISYAIKLTHQIWPSHLGVPHDH